VAADPFGSYADPRQLLGRGAGSTAVVLCMEQTCYGVLEARIKIERIFVGRSHYAADHGPKVAAKSAGAISGAVLSSKCCSRFLRTPC